VEPKKTFQIYYRVPETIKAEFKRALKRRGLTEALFLRASAEALIHLDHTNEDLSLPIRLLTVQERQRRKKAP